MENNNDQYRHRIELKRGQLAIVKYALEVYVTSLSEEYSNQPTSKSLKKLVEAQAVLRLVKGK
jgi:hypothetical protein